MEGSHGTGGEGFDYVRKTVTKDSMLRLAESFESDALDWTSDNRGTNVAVQMKYEGHAEGLREAATAIRQRLNDGIEPSRGW
jgi:hypothetical protein